VVVAAINARLAEHGEPILARFVPEKLAVKLEAMGFSKIALLSPMAAHERYFAGRRDGLDANEVLQIMRVTV